jgi:hypothetical protein
LLGVVRAREDGELRRDGRGVTGAIASDRIVGVGFSEGKDDLTSRRRPEVERQRGEAQTDPQRTARCHRSILLRRFGES